MNATALVFAAALVLWALTFRAKAVTEKRAETKRPALEELYREVGVRHGVNPRLLRAIAIIESGEDVDAVNPADPSFGIMQLLCTVDNSGQRVCRNTLNLPGWPPSKKQQLFDPVYNLEIAAGILRWNLENYGFPRGVAMYNAFGARMDPQNGPFRNQGYVEKVLGEFNKLGGGKWNATPKQAARPLG